MKCTVLDTVTGETRISEGIATWNWKEGNWSCDCNRAIIFDRWIADGFCVGGKRYLVIAAEPEDKDDYEVSLAELNSDYPDELLREHGINV